MTTHSVGTPGGRAVGLEGGAMKQLFDDLRQFAIEVRQVGFSLGGGVGERECLDLSERMFAAVEQAQARMAAKSNPALYS